VVEKIHALTTHLLTWQETTELVEKLNRSLRGWANYFRTGRLVVSCVAVPSLAGQPCYLGWRRKRAGWRVAPSQLAVDGQIEKR